MAAQTARGPLGWQRRRRPEHVVALMPLAPRRHRGGEDAENDRDPQSSFFEAFSDAFTFSDGPAPIVVDSIGGGGAKGGEGAKRRACDRLIQVTRLIVAPDRRSCQKALRAVSLRPHRHSRPDAGTGPRRRALSNAIWTRSDKTRRPAWPSSMAGGALRMRNKYASLVRRNPRLGSGFIPHLDSVQGLCENPTGARQPSLRRADTVCIADNPIPRRETYRGATQLVLPRIRFTHGNTPYGMGRVSDGDNKDHVKTTSLSCGLHTVDGRIGAKKGPRVRSRYGPVRQDGYRRLPTRPRIGAQQHIVAIAAPSLLVQMPSSSSSSPLQTPLRMGPDENGCDKQTPKRIDVDSHLCTRLRGRDKICVSPGKRAVGGARPQGLQSPNAHDDDGWRQRPTDPVPDTAGRRLAADATSPESAVSHMPVWCDSKGIETDENQTTIAPRQESHRRQRDRQQSRQRRQGHASADGVSRTSSFARCMIRMWERLADLCRAWHATLPCRHVASLPNPASVVDSQPKRPCAPSALLQRMAAHDRPLIVRDPRHRGLLYRIDLDLERIECFAPAAASATNRLLVVDPTEPLVSIGPEPKSADRDCASSVDPLTAPMRRCWRSITFCLDVKRTDDDQVVLYGLLVPDWASWALVVRSLERNGTPHAGYLDRRVEGPHQTDRYQVHVTIRPAVPDDDHDDQSV